MIICFFALFSINMVYCVINFQMLNQPFFPRINLTCLWNENSFVYAIWFGLPAFFKKYFCIYIQKIDLLFSFLVMSMLYFDIRVILTSNNEFQSVPSSVFGECLKDWHQFFFKCWVNSPVKPSQSDIFFAESFFILLNQSIYWIYSDFLHLLA